VQDSKIWVSQILLSCTSPGVRPYMSQPVGEIRISRYFPVKMLRFAKCHSKPGMSHYIPV
jgi:hypothetical protein